MLMISSTKCYQKKKYQNISIEISLFGSARWVCQRNPFPNTLNFYYKLSPPLISSRNPKFSFYLGHNHYRK